MFAYQSKSSVFFYNNGMANVFICKRWVTFVIRRQVLVHPGGKERAGARYLRVLAVYCALHAVDRIILSRSRPSSH